MNSRSCGHQAIHNPTCILLNLYWIQSCTRIPKIAALVITPCIKGHCQASQRRTVGRSAGDLSRSLLPQHVNKNACSLSRKTNSIRQRNRGSSVLSLPLASYASCLSMLVCSYSLQSQALYLCHSFPSISAGASAKVRCSSARVCDNTSM